MNAGLKSYFAPTPKLMRKIGDSILLIGMTFTTWAGVSGQAHWLIITGAIATLTGKVMTNFFSEDV